MGRASNCRFEKIRNRSLRKKRKKSYNRKLSVSKELITHKKIKCARKMIQNISQSIGNIAPAYGYVFPLISARSTKRPKESALRRDWKIFRLAERHVVGRHKRSEMIPANSSTIVLVCRVMPMRPEISKQAAKKSDKMSCQPAAVL